MTVQDPLLTPGIPLAEGWSGGGFTVASDAANLGVWMCLVLLVGTDVQPPRENGILLSFVLWGSLKPRGSWKNSCGPGRPISTRCRLSLRVAAPMMHPGPKGPKQVPPAVN